MRFLGLTRRTITDEPAVEAVDEIPAVEEDLTTDPPGEGSPFVAAVAAKPAVTHEEIVSCWVETDVKQVVDNVAAGTSEYYEIQFDANLKPKLRVVRLKSGPALPAPARTIREVENEDGDSIGSAIIDA